MISILVEYSKEGDKHRVQLEDFWSKKELLDVTSADMTEILSCIDEAGYLEKLTDDQFEQLKRPHLITDMRSISVKNKTV